MATLLAIAASCLLPGCRAGAGEDCTRAECDEGLSCHEWVCRPADEVKRIRADLELAKKCKLTCALDGLCGGKDGKCIAIDQADCRTSEACQRTGACSLHDGSCAVVTDDDCKRGRVCTEDGKCHASGGACTLAPGACKTRPECKERGLCSEKGNACVAGTDAECEASQACWVGAECTARDAKCVQADDDCARSHWCARFALCRLGPGPGGCVKDAERFADSIACARYGCCGQGPGSTCRPRGEADCKSSAICASEGRCQVRSDRCVRNCKETPDCASSGLCIDGPGTTCVAGSDEDCASSSDCKGYAMCTAKGGKCVATDASCAAHKRCHDHQLCWAKGGKCTATQEACRDHENCRKYGWCGEVGGWCKATTLEHCKQSEVCARAQRCRLKDGRCETEP